MVIKFKWWKRLWYWLRRRPVYVVGFDPAYGEDQSYMAVFSVKDGVFTLAGELPNAASIDDVWDDVTFVRHPD